MNKESRLELFKNACRDAGLKLTHQRLEIYRELVGANDHPSAETIHQRLATKLPTLSLDTIYRTLNTFEKYGLVTKVQTIESQARFEAEMGLHHHVICKKCGSITDFQWEMFDDTALPGKISEWGEIEQKKVTILGKCNSCATKNKSS